jgi:tRNA (guanine-N7-)-methyltransferase
MELSTIHMKPKYLSLKPFILWKREKRPIEWQRVFGRSAGLEVEIGFGLGDFLVRRAREKPENDIVGIEVAWVLVRRALRKIAIAGVPNARVIRADARVCFERVFSEKSLGRAWALFPCPWPKKRHLKHRLFTHDFLKLLNSRLIDDGELLIVTDDQPYFDWILTQVSGTGFEPHTQSIPPRFLTKYERKWQGLGQQRFFELRLIKCRHIEITPKEEKEVITHCVDHFDPKTFKPINGRGGIMVDFREFLFDQEQRKGMVRSVVGEDDLLQNFWIEIVELEDGWHIRPAKGCSMIPTAGVQRALDLVRNASEV